MRTKTVRQLAWRFFSESHRTGGESSIAENYTLFCLFIYIICQKSALRRSFGTFPKILSCNRSQGAIVGSLPSNIVLPTALNNQGEISVHVMF